MAAARASSDCCFNDFGVFRVALGAAAASAMAGNAGGAVNAGVPRMVLMALTMPSCVVARAF